MKKKFAKRVLSVFICCLMVLSTNLVAFASEDNVTETSGLEYSVIPISDASIQSVNNEIITRFSGQYTGWLDISFTVTDSSRPVKVLYAIKGLDGSEMTTHLGVRMSSSSLWFWTKLNITGYQVIEQIGKLKPGDYVLRIKTGSISDQYVIAGEVYYFG